MKNLTHFAHGIIAVITALVGILLVLLVEAIFLSPALAESAQCGGVADLLAQLGNRYHEQQLFIGQMGQGANLIITANPSQTSWTALVVSLDGRACIAAIGADWRAGDTPGPPTLGTEG